MPSVNSTCSSDRSSSAVDFDSCNGIISGLDKYLLTESQVQTSQDVRIFYCTDGSTLNGPPFIKEGDEESVEFLGESGNAITDYPHHRFDCVKYPFSADPNVHCLNCFCVLCEEKASDCKEWDTHCSVSREEYRDMLRSRISTEKENIVDPPLVIAEVSNEKEMIMTEKKLLAMEKQVKRLEHEK